jgi:hypothetical protein
MWGAYPESMTRAPPVCQGAARLTGTLMDRGPQLLGSGVAERRLKRAAGRSAGLSRRPHRRRWQRPVGTRPRALRAGTRAAVAGSNRGGGGCGRTMLSGLTASAAIGVRPATMPQPNRRTVCPGSGVAGRGLWRRERRGQRDRRLVREPLLSAASSGRGVPAKAGTLSRSGPRLLFGDSARSGELTGCRTVSP